MLNTTLGQLLVNEALPPTLRDYSRTLDKKATAELFERVAREHPEQYGQILKRVLDVGREVSYITGGNSFGTEHLRPGAATQVARQRIREARRQIYDDDALDDDAKQKKLMGVVETARAKMVGDLYKESLAEKNPFAMQVISGARGSDTNLSSLRGFDGAYEDQNGDVVPIPVTRNYGEGLTPVEYFAGTFGARRGVTDVKLGVAKAGFTAKQLSQLAHRLVVSATDDDEDTDNSRRLGLPSPIDDKDNEGSLLAIDHGPYKRNTIVTPKIARDLQKSGFDELLLRSTTVGGPSDGGVYARDAGVRERGGVAPLGDYIGIAAAGSISEQLTQAGLNSKHKGGIAGSGPSGYELLSQLVQVPENFSGGATHAQHDGHVQDIREAPQGGQFVTINGEEHYVPANLKLSVKAGDTVEAGDTISAGVPNPSEIVKHKGIGEGRKYFTQAFRKAYEESGMRSHRRNIELISRGLIDHVRVTEPWENYAPDDIIPYREAASLWEPRAGSAAVAPQKAVGKYLERPTLHYTVGTKIKPSMLKTLDKFGVTGVEVHDDPPPFEPDMQRAMASISTDPDWMTRMLGSGQKTSLLDAVHRGAVSDTESTSYVPSLAIGTPFGKTPLTQGWKP